MGGGHSPLPPAPSAGVGREDADLVAVGIAQVGAILLAWRVRAHARLAFAGAAIGETGRMPGIDRGGVLRHETQRVAVGDGLHIAIGRLRHDQRRNWCEVELADGCRVAFSFHLFSTDELASLFKGIFEIEALEGLDFFHGRFAADPRWNPPGQDLPQALALELAKMEKHLSASREYNDNANQLLLIGRKVATVRQTDNQRRPKLTLRSARQR